MHEILFQAIKSWFIRSRSFSCLTCWRRERWGENGRISRRNNARASTFHRAPEKSKTRPKIYCHIFHFSIHRMLHSNFGALNSELVAGRIPARGRWAASRVLPWSCPPRSSGPRRSSFAGRTPSPPVATPPGKSNEKDKPRQLRNLKFCQAKYYRKLCVEDKQVCFINNYNFGTKAVPYLKLFTYFSPRKKKSIFRPLGPIVRGCPGRVHHSYQSGIYIYPHFSEKYHNASCILACTEKIVWEREARGVGVCPWGQPVKRNYFS